MNPLPLLVGTETTGQNLSKTIQSNTPIQKYYTPIGPKPRMKPKQNNSKLNFFAKRFIPQMATLLS